MEIGKLKEILKDFKSGIKFEHDLRKKNWFNIGGKSKIFYQANTLKELIQIPRYTCIKYKVLNKKIQWGILYDIILFDNATILILRKGDYLWKHKIDFNKMKYSYTKKI